MNNHIKPISAARFSGWSKLTVATVALLACLAVTAPVGAIVLNYDFEGSNEGWVATKTSPGDPPTQYESTNRIDTVAANTGTWRVIPKVIGAFSPTEDSTHDTLVFSSPEFILGPSGSIDLYLHIGGSPAPDPGPDFASLPASSSLTGYSGVGLRRVSDGAYVLNVKHTAGDWQLRQFSNASLAANSLLGIPLALDLIDFHHGGGGWIALDTVTINDVLIIPEPSTVLLFSLGGWLLRRQRRK